MSEWQPIETAPKDGTPFLAYVPYVYRAGGTGEPESRWDIHIIALDTNYEQPQIDSDFDQGWDFDCYEAWMPLPAPPAEPHSGVSP